MTHSPITDGELDARVLAAFDYSPTPDDDVRAEAGSDGAEVSMREAEHYNDMALPSGQVRFGLHGLPAVRDQLNLVAHQHHYGPLPIQVGEWRLKMPGVRLPEFDDGDPSHFRGTFVYFASAPHILHSMRYDTVEGLIARQLKKRTECDWRGVNVFCADYAREYLCFARGQHVIAFATCFECVWWLLNGAPDPNAYNAMRNERLDSQRTDDVGR